MLWTHGDFDSGTDPVAGARVQVPSLAEQECLFSTRARDYFMLITGVRAKRPENLVKGCRPVAVQPTETGHADEARLIAVIEKGHLGRKTGEGFYDHE